MSSQLSTTVLAFAESYLQSVDELVVLAAMMYSSDRLPMSPIPLASQPSAGRLSAALATPRTCPLVVVTDVRRRVAILR